MRLFVDFASSPIAIDTLHPRFSWEVPLKGRARKQTAYQIRVARSMDLLDQEEADLWDSGKVNSDQSVDIVYSGEPLNSNMDCYWNVTLWDESDSIIESQGADRFSIPLLKEDDWAAEWIGMGAPDEPCSDEAAFQGKGLSDEVKAVEPDQRSPMLRREFSIDKPLRRARAYVCGVGLFELHLNGNKVSNDLLSTPRTDFRQRLLYSTYDITSQLAEGDNAIGILLGNGWFNGQKKFWGWQYQWYGSPRALVQLDLEFTDGSTDRVISDGSWRGDWSPIISNCIHDGEVYDARLEQDGWAAPGFDSGNWKPVNTVPSPGGALVPVTHEAEKITDTMSPVSISEPEPDIYVVDLGRNITGWLRMKLSDYPEGTTLTFHHGEAIYEDGSLNSSSNNAALQEDRYTTKGGDTEYYEPRFTYHGFQFVKITGLIKPPKPEDITGCFVRTAVEQTGSFECSNELINKIHRCTLQSQLCNVQMGVPTDDTQRPERLGWGADAWATANQALYNLSMVKVYEKWIGDIRDQQDPETGMVGMIAPQAGSGEDLVWSAAFLIIPWLTYLHTGNRRILEDNYPSMKRYLEYLRNTGIKDVQSMTTEEALESILWGCSREDRFPSDEDRGYLQISQWGDHLSLAPGFVTRSNQPISVATAFYYHDVSIMANIAGVLGHEEDKKDFDSLAGNISDAFNARFYDEKLGFYDSGTQSTQAWPLVFGLVPEDQRERVTTYFVNNVGNRQRHLTTGYVGTKFAIQALAEAGSNDLVWQLATSTNYPSWGHMLRLNRTTTCEQWNGERGSLNHAPLGAAIDEWFYWGLAGIQPDKSAPGYQSIMFKPFIPDELSWARASVKSVRGTIRSAWRKDNKQVTLELTVPANCQGTVFIPTAKVADIFEGGVPYAQAKGVSLVNCGETETCFRLGSGSYAFEFPMD